MVVARTESPGGGWLPSRRQLVVGGAALVTTIASQGVTSSPAVAAKSYVVNPYTRTKVPTRQQLHMMNRMGCGYSRGTYAKLRKAGGVAQWFDTQLSPNKVKESARALQIIDWFPDLRETPSRMWERQLTKSKGGWVYAQDLANYSMLRRVYSNRQIHENMVDFWSNHLHISATDTYAWVHRYSYDRVIRKHALGRFDEMLVAATLHPAMLLFLDNWRSAKDAPNENHGRELLELHTVGRTSGYTEDMVKDSAKILSGFTVDVRGTWGGYYRPSDHTTGPVNVLGFSAENPSIEGEQLTREYLTFLAHHPATSRTIARKLAVRFVSDAPSDALVNHLAKVFRDSNTDIKTTLRALVAHSEYIASAGKKIRTPIEDFVATTRLLGVDVAAPTSDNSFARVAFRAHEGMLLFHWPRPDGPPESGAAWSSATRMLNSFRMHWRLGGGGFSNLDVTYKKPVSWLPQRRIRMDQYVDHLCRMLHGKASTPQLLQAAVKALDIPPHEVITKDHAITRWLFVRLLAVLLDSPVHMSR